MVKYATRKELLKFDKDCPVEFPPNLMYLSKLDNHRDPLLGGFRKTSEVIMWKRNQVVMWVEVESLDYSMIYNQ